MPRLIKRPANKCSWSFHFIGTSQIRRAKITDQNATPNRKGALLLAFRLTKGVKNASDELLESAVSVSERLALFFGAAVFVGVAADFVLPALALVSNGLWPAGVVAIGVGGELLFSFRGARLQNVLLERSKTRLADAETLAFLASGDAIRASNQAATALEELGTANVRLAEAMEVAAAANERAAKAELALEKLKHPRTILAHEKTSIVDCSGGGGTGAT